jgi:nucleoside-diphosphate-sugar epimerase
MGILTTGNMDYVGPILTRFLRENVKDAELIGFDAGFFGQSLNWRRPFTRGPLGPAGVPRYLESRRLPLDGVDAVVHLSAVSNDSMGNKFEAVTGDINQKASVRIARLAAARGVKSFVFASNCSMYGYAERGLGRDSAVVSRLRLVVNSMFDQGPSWF